jgi:magnesium transporter
MIKEIVVAKDIHPGEPTESLLWVDVVQPQDSELNILAERFQLHKAALMDCLEPEHLPKIDFFGDIAFLILRTYDVNSSENGNTPQQITRKIALFLLPNAIITVHRLEVDFIATLRAQWSTPLAKQNLSYRLLSDIIRGVVDSYEPFIQKLNFSLNAIEHSIFHGSNSANLFNEGYYLRRKAHISRYILGLTSDVIGSLLEVIPETSSPYFSRINHKCNRLHYYSEDILNNVDNLLNLHLAVIARQSNDSSHRINEVMRFLTVFSAFFLPLNFIASIYGMNFENMPELKNPYGYHVTLGTMIFVGLVVLWFFRKKGYLSESERKHNA